MGMIFFGEMIWCEEKNESAEICFEERQEEILAEMSWS